MIDFEKYFKEIFKENAKPKLFHDWLYDQMFHEEQLSPPLEKKIKTAIYMTLTTAFWTSSFTKMSYAKELASRVRVPSGFYQGKKISEVPGSKDGWDLLYQLKETTKDENIRQAVTNRMGELKIQKDLAEDYANKKSKNRKKRYS